MIVVGRPIQERFKKKHADVRQQINVWLAEAAEAEWQSPQDIKTRYGSASFPGSNRIVFNLKGGHYRLLVKVAYNTQVVIVLNIGTHAEYDSWKL